MKKLITLFVLVAGLASSASAYHMAQNDDTGANISDSSPHLLVTFY